MAKRWLHPQLNHVQPCPCTSPAGGSVAASSVPGGCEAPMKHAAVPESLCCFQKQGPTLLPGLFFPPVLSLSCSYYRLLGITYFATSSSTKSPARIARILGGGNYLIEITRFGALIASTLPARLRVLTAGAESCATALLSRKPSSVSDN